MQAKPQNSQTTLQMGLLKYKGGGDWYANPTALPNLASFCKQKLYSNFELDYATVDVGSAEIFDYAFLHMTGHGNVVFSDAEAENLRTYLISGGFLHIDDNYGMDPFIRPAMKKVFPELDFVELPYDHPIYNMNYKFKGEFLRSISMTTSPHRVLPCFGRAEWFASTVTKRIWEMVGRIRRSTTTLRINAYSLCKWGPIWFNTLLSISKMQQLLGESP